MACSQWWGSSPGPAPDQRGQTCAPSLLTLMAGCRCWPSSDRGSICGVLQTNGESSGERSKIRTKNENALCSYWHIIRQAHATATSGRQLVRSAPPPACARSAATGCPRLAPGSVVRGRGPARCCRRVRGIAVQSLQCEPGGTRACVAPHRWQVAARSERRPSASRRRALGMSWWGCRWACAWSISCSACSLSHQLVERFPTPSLRAARH